MRKAKTCCGCYAWLFNEGCTLGHEIESYQLTGTLRASRPVKCCHKPKTLEDYWLRLKSLRK